MVQAKIILEDAEGGRTDVRVEFDRPVNPKNSDSQAVQAAMMIMGFMIDNSEGEASFIIGNQNGTQKGIIKDGDIHITG